MPGINLVSEVWSHRGLVAYIRTHTQTRTNTYIHTYIYINVFLPATVSIMPVSLSRLGVTSKVSTSRSYLEKKW